MSNHSTSRGLSSALCVALALAAVHSARAGKPGESLGRKHTSIERLKIERLEAAHDDVIRHRGQRKDLPPLPGFTDFRAVLHAHAEDSAHTGGTRPEMLEDAKKAGVHIIMLTDHFRPPRDFMDSWRGLRDGVLFIPGSEAKGFLVYPDESIFSAMDSPKEELIAATSKNTGLIFLSHVEEREAHSLEGLTGMEIYNRHADAKDDMNVLFTLAGWATMPGKIAQVQEALKRYHAEFLASQLDYPELYLEKWDRETQHRTVVGVAANDCHHNQVLVVKMVDEENALLGTIVDDEDEMRKVTVKQRPGLEELMKGHKPGDIVVRLDLDPYDVSFHTVSTHILATELSEPAVREALADGRAYVAHDWIADPTGFRFGGHLGASQKPLMMGAEEPYQAQSVLTAEFPVPCDIRLLKNGEVVSESHGAKLEYTPTSPGVYRVEGWLDIDSEDRVWIYSNPIYLR